MDVMYFFKSIWKKKNICSYSKTVTRNSLAKRLKKVKEVRLLITWPKDTSKYERKKSTFRRHHNAIIKTI